MKTTSCIHLIILMLVCSFTATTAQDSLYLIGSITGEKTSNRVVGVEWVGDVNGDGFDDVLINTFSDKNYSALYYGGAELDTVADVILTGDLSFGAGDVNGDGYRDIILGDVNYAERGRVRIFSVQPISQVDKSKSSKPDEFRVLQNYPNPFNATTRIDFLLEKNSHVSLAIYNRLGQIVQTLVNSRLDKGRHSVIWNAAGLPSGIYFCRIESESSSGVIKLLLIK
jgi:hypothetical protein